MEKITGNEPINPAILRRTGEESFRLASEKDRREGIYLSSNMGITLRQHYAGLAMQGLLASYGTHDVTEYSEIASDAILAADALIEQLNK